MNIPLDLKLLIRSMPDIKAITKWMRKHAVPFKTVEPQSGGEDLAALKKIIGNARIAAIGEATHGTHEFFKMKHRIFKYLVEQMGFTVFALEANMPEARAVNNYVLNGSGDPKTALQNLYSWPWKTEELLDMIEWMHAYNANPDHLRKVKFYGYDMQVANRAMSNVMEFLQRADPEYAAHAEEVLSAVPLTEQEREHFPKEPDANSRTVENIEDVLAHIDSMSHDGEEWREARQDALVMQQAVRMLLAGDQRNTLRDEAMAANAAWILEQEGDGAKMMIWAHNDHVRTTMADGKTWMGGHLRKRFDKELITMGFAFNQGAFLAKEAGKEPQEFHEPPAMPGTLDAVLAGTKIPLFALDLRAVDKKSVMEWVRSPQKTREMGSVYFGDKSVWQIEQSPVEAFDVLLFVESTTPTRLLSFSTKIPQPDLQ